MNSLSTGGGGGAGGGGGGKKSKGDFDDYDLVSSNPNQRNWRGIIIAMLVIAAVLGLIVTSVVLLTPPDDGPRIKGARIRLQDVLNHELTPLRHNGSWISGVELMFRDEWGGISAINATSLAIRTLVSNQTLRRLNPIKFSISADGQFILLVHNVQKLFRHSFLAQYSIYELKTTDLFPLLVGDVKGHPFLLHAEWSSVGQSLIIVHDYDIYYKTAPRDEKTFRVTRTAVPGIISNGVPDWLYEEEILGTNTALWMSSDGNLLLYACFNDSLVGEVKFPWYGTSDDSQQYYPEIRSLRYPKAGTNNPEVSLFVADLSDVSNIKTKLLKPPMMLGQTKGYYFSAVTLISSNEACVVWLNRAQNTSMTTICKSPLWTCIEAQRVSGEGRGWVDPQSAPLFSPDGNVYLTLVPVRDGTSGFFRHIVSVNINKKHMLPLTHGTYEINKIVAWDHEHHLAYYLGVPSDDPAQLHLYSVETEAPITGGPIAKPICLTCPASPNAPPVIHYEGASTTSAKSGSDPSKMFYDAEEEVQEQAPTNEPSTKKKRKKTGEEREKLEELYKPCTYHNVVFSPDLSHYVLECLGPGIPTVSLYATNPNGKPRLLTILQNNTKLHERVSKIALPQVKTFPVQISGGYQAHVRLHFPPGLKEEEITRYPLVLHVYGGPGTQLVTDIWKIDWDTYLSSTRDYIVAQIDGRGASGQGYQKLHQVYKRLGSVEVADQLEVTEYLRDNLHVIDKRRVAVWGWSYGGFVSAMLLSTPNQDVFHCGIAVAPVTSWRLYDSAYTERFMGVPNVTGNYKGYEESDLSRRVEGFRDKMLFLVHGTADDNVHLQQSMILARALSNAGVLYRQQIYPDEAHTLSGAKRHLYRSMANFFDDCFRKQVPPDFKAGLRNGGGSTFVDH
ncbi:inactive dipeptidyl peptidase 10 isoform X2 [Bemisia tabaci]|uniref:inactive dipeptidyl peptidase 10 isoform X2 n=1 Tax=Bemisia tabaci TaxID=7038 RepID=UPI0008F9D6F4|nr:PREDICTED: inactive dipeptidyl peptidase 10 isoform X2 [Bemisia tabaci]